MREVTTDVGSDSTRLGVESFLVSEVGMKLADEAIAARLLRSAADRGDTVAKNALQIGHLRCLYWVRFQPGESLAQNLKIGALGLNTHTAPWLPRVSTLWGGGAETMIFSIEEIMLDLLLLGK